MTANEVSPTPEQELVLGADDYGACIRLGDITTYIPGANHEDRADWLMGFWENLTDYMANHTGTKHLIEWVEGGRK